MNLNHHFAALVAHHTDGAPRPGSIETTATRKQAVSTPWASTSDGAWQRYYDGLLLMVVDEGDDEGLVYIVGEGDAALSGRVLEGEQEPGETLLEATQGIAEAVARNEFDVWEGA